jgi:hypothetical protein
MSDATDIKIAALINSYINAARVSTKKEGVDLVGAAFRQIQRDRQEQCLSDEIYSSAEHYLTARYLASFAPGPAAIASLAYDGGKSIIGSENVQKVGLGNSCPASEYTFRQTQWKLKGVSDGKMDFVLPARHIAPVDTSGLVLATVAVIPSPLAPFLQIADVARELL